MAKKRSRKNIKDAIWRLCQDIVRLRDDNTCQMCNKHAVGSDAHTSHVKNKGKYAFLEFDLLNLKLLCTYCHLHIWHKDPTFAGRWFAKKFPVRMQYLDDKIRDSSERTKTIRDSDLIEIETNLKNKLAELQND